MPQMSPLSWLLLYIFFSSLFILSMIINYYSFLYKPKMIKIKKKTTMINWKW